MGVKKASKKSDMPVKSTTKKKMTLAELNAEIDTKLALGAKTPELTLEQALAEKDKMDAGKPRAQWTAKQLPRYLELLEVINDPPQSAGGTT